MPKQSAQRPMSYLRADCVLTLRDAIVELREAEGLDGDAANQVAPELAADLDVHDAIHVLFGCPTNLAGEIIAHGWTLFGTTARLSEMHRVAAHRDHRKVLAQIGHGRLIQMWAISLWRLLNVYRQSWKMKRRWPVDQINKFLDRRLLDIRAEYRIELVTVKSAKKASSNGGALLRRIGLERTSTSAAK